MQINVHRCGTVPPEGEMTFSHGTGAATELAGLRSLPAESGTAPGHLLLICQLAVAHVGVASVHAPANPF